MTTRVGSPPVCESMTLIFFTRPTSRNSLSKQPVKHLRFCVGLFPRAVAQSRILGVFCYSAMIAPGFDQITLLLNWHNVIVIGMESPDGKLRSRFCNHLGIASRTDRHGRGEETWSENHHCPDGVPAH